MPDRLPPPGPSFLREHEVRIGERILRAGMARPSDAPDGWWLTLLWVTDDEGVVSFRDDIYEYDAQGKVTFESA